MVLIVWYTCSWIYNYLWNQCLSPLTLWVRMWLRRGVLDTTLCDKVCQWLAAGQWFSPDTPVSFTNKTDHHDIAVILLKVALNTVTITLTLMKVFHVLLKEILLSDDFCWWKIIFSKTGAHQEACLSTCFPI
jgi:hypothetical protein